MGNVDKIDRKLADRALLLLRVTAGLDAMDRRYSRPSPSITQGRSGSRPGGGAVGLLTIEDHRAVLIQKGSCNARRAAY
jgi:hypothetical protein